MSDHWPNHAAMWREWRAALGGERMHHAWLLAGKRGLGKRTFALAAARELVAEPGIRQPEDHPDIVHLTHLPKDDKEAKKREEGKPFQTKRNIAVDQIREMQRRLTTRPTLGSRRAIIIDPADDLEKSASNALLKSLEEPPQGTFFLLVAHRPSRLLPTIRSRCRILRFLPLGENDLTDMLAARGHPSDPDALRAAGGSFGAALHFMEQDLGKAARLIDGLLTGGERGIIGRSELAREIGARPDRQRLQAVLDLAQTLVAARARSTEDPVFRAKLIECHARLVALAGEAVTYNFDSGILSLEIGTLLVEASEASEQPHGAQ
ncbi:MAG: AAA family ATPase [Erythrobacter sp.]|jgi:DNA polymerase-3 subunit delta'|nr:AAA family ATPase [Erythrobacter sp.]